jgi:hypothetical protein
MLAQEVSQAAEAECEAETTTRAFSQLRAAAAESVDARGRPREVERGDKRAEHDDADALRRGRSQSMPPQPPQDSADRRTQSAVGPDGVRRGDANRRSPWPGVGRRSPGPRPSGSARSSCRRRRSASRRWPSAMPVGARRLPLLRRIRIADPRRLDPGEVPRAVRLAPDPTRLLGPAHRRLAHPEVPAKLAITSRPHR